MRRSASTATHLLPMALVVALLAVGLGMWVARSRNSEDARPFTSDTMVAGAESNIVAVDLATTPVPAERARPTTAAPVDSFSPADFDTTLRVLRGQPTGESVRAALVTLAGHLRSLDSARAAQAITAFLGSGADAPTGMPFSLEKDGRLGTAPTLRTFLLDYLAQIDSAEAAQYGRTILARPDSADEWALALRSVARGDSSPTTAGFLAEKFRELTQYGAWRAAPSVGFLESFDVPVYLKNTELLPVLATLAGNTEEKATGYAAALALERLAVTEPGLILEAWNQNPSLLAEAPESRANCFGRADISQPNQRAALEAYLTSREITPAEIRSFAEMFPNRNYRISHNLLTDTPTPTRAQIVADDRAALAAVDQWLSDPRFAPHREVLSRTRERLADFVRQASSK